MGINFSRRFSANSLRSKKMTTPLSILHESIKAVPAVKYALGVAGIASVIAIIRSLKIDFNIAALGIIVMLVLMTILVIFARLTKLAPADLRLPALVLTWSALLFMIAVAFGMLFTVFLDWRIKDVRSWLTPTTITNQDCPDVIFTDNTKNPSETTRISSCD